jgi:predicted RNA-binding Zn-ribbon protein involved in translation (DUF1610 family)
MSSEMKKCEKCGWTGYNAKLSLCFSCDTTYYKCPNCGSKTKIIIRIS